MIDTFKEIAQDFKSAAVNPAEIQDPSRLSRVCQAVKVLAVVAAIVAVAAAVFCGPLGLILASIFALGMYDAYKLADNIQKIADKKVAGVDVPAPTTPDELTRNVARGTIFAKLIMSLTLPKERKPPAAPVA